MPQSRYHFQARTSLTQGSAARQDLVFLAPNSALSPANPAATRRKETRTSHGSPVFSSQVNLAVRGLVPPIARCAVCALRRDLVGAQTRPRTKRKVGTRLQRRAELEARTREAVASTSSLLWGIREPGRGRFVLQTVLLTCWGSLPIRFGPFSHLGRQGLSCHRFCYRPFYGLEQRRPHQQRPHSIRIITYICYYSPSPLRRRGKPALRLLTGPRASEIITGPSPTAQTLLFSPPRPFARNHAARRWRRGLCAGWEQLQRLREIPLSLSVLPRCPAHPPLNHNAGKCANMVSSLKVRKLYKYE